MTAHAVISINHGGFRPPWFALCTTAVLTALFFIFGAAPEALVLDRQALMAGEIWRLFSAHLVHSDLSHLAWNLGAYLLLGGFLESHCGLGPKDQIAVFTASSLVVGFAVFMLRPDIQWYVGLSGVLNSLFVLSLWNIWQRYRHPITVLVAFGTLAKITVEQITQTSALGSGTWPVVAEAHGAGLIAGLLLLLLKQDKVQERRQKQFRQKSGMH